MKESLTKGEISILKDYEVHLNRALDGYVRGIYTTDLNKIEPIYNRLGYRLENRSCANCVLGMLNHLAKIYFKKL